MTILSIKVNLQKSLHIFMASVFVIATLIFLSVYLGYDKWMIGFAPSIIILGLIGAFAVTRAIVYLSSVEGELEKEDNAEIAQKFQGIDGVKGLFYLLVPLIYGTTYIILGSCGYNIFDLSIYHPLLSVLLLGGILVIIYYVVDNLSFCLFFISIIYGWTKTSKVKKVSEDIADMFIAEDYDVDKNVKKLIIKYVERVQWLETHINEENMQEYKAKIASYQTIINDLKDFIYGIDI